MNNPENMPHFNFQQQQQGYVPQNQSVNKNIQTSNCLMPGNLEQYGAPQQNQNGFMNPKSFTQQQGQRWEIPIKKDQIHAKRRPFAEVSTNKGIFLLI